MSLGAFLGASIKSLSMKLLKFGHSGVKFDYSPRTKSRFQAASWRVKTRKLQGFAGFSLSCGMSRRYHPIPPQMAVFLAVLPSYRQPIPSSLRQKAQATLQDIGSAKH
jgi:hypothetical protein